MIAFKLIIDSSLKIIGFDNEAKKFNPSIKLYTELSEYFRKELCEIILKAILEGKEVHTFQTNYEETIAINQIVLNSSRTYIVDVKQVIRSVSTESYLKAIAQSQVHAQLLIDHNNELLWFNKKAAEILYSLIGKTPEKGDLVSSYKISKNQDQFDFHINMAQSGALASYDERFELPDASELWLKQEFLPVIDNNGIIQGVAYNLHDITLSKRVVNQLLQAEDRYKSLINNLNVGVIIHKKGQIVYCNNAAAKIA